MTQDEVKAKLALKARAVANVLATEDGQTLLRAVKEEFLKEPRRLLGADPQETGYRIGAYDVVFFLEQLQKFHENGGK